MKLSAPVFRLKRRARTLARERKIPLHQALDRLARREGFRSWGHLSASASGNSPATEMLARLDPGDLVLLGARPGHGKTLLGLDLAAAAARSGRSAFVFTLEDTEADICDRLQSLGLSQNLIRQSLTLDTSDDICAGYIVDRLERAPGDVFAVIDYLQLLDQIRRHPELAVQVMQLKAFADSTGAIIVTLSQIGRSFKAGGKPLPELSDIRLPNPVDLSLFTRTCFMHDGKIRLDPRP